LNTTAGSIWKQFESACKQPASEPIDGYQEVRSDKISIRSCLNNELTYQKNAYAGNASNPDELLAYVQEEERPKSVAAKIFLGYAAGVGKLMPCSKLPTSAKKKVWIL
jgi:hypothetical protein